MKRRSFLAMLGLAPVVGASAIIAKQEGQATAAKVSPATIIEMSSISAEEKRRIMQSALRGMDIRSLDALSTHPYGNHSHGRINYG